MNGIHRAVLRQRVWFAFLFTLPLGLFILLSTVSSSPTSAATSITFVPVADSYVNSGSPTSNYGTSAQLRADASPVTNSYIRFNITGLSGNITSATLRVYATSSQSTGYTAATVGDNTWGETTINYSNAPALGSSLASTGAVSANTWTSVNVTAYITGNGTFSVGLATTNSTALAMSSRETGANAPQLVVTTDAGTTATATSTATRTATPATTTTRTPTPTPTSASDPFIMAAGDIACDPTNSSFNSGQGTSNACRQLYTSNLILNANPAAVLALGDDQYYCGGYNAFVQSYGLSWGRFNAKIHPVPGNHEYLTSGGTDCTTANAGAAGYFQYFGSAAGQSGQGWYSYDIGRWHLIALNSNCGDVGGCSTSSPQGQWLLSDLAAHPAACTLAYWHIPLWSSGGRAASNMATITQILYKNNADVVLAGHDHDYERFALQDYLGNPDPTRGIRAFVVGTGGANHTVFTTTAPNSEVRNATTFGLLKLTLLATSYDWKFVPDTGTGTFTDSGSASCH